jgi:predicted nucleotide-binding protein (sugar kinase/HSP70/actin superfamily)
MTIEQLKDRKLFIPDMDYGGSRTIAAALRHAGIDAHPVPQSTGEALKKGFECTSGEECFPQQITLGDFLHILDAGLVKSSEAAFFMPIATGPCRFGQYATLIRQALQDRGYGDAIVYSLHSEDGYAGLGGTSFTRRMWWGIVCSDVLRRALLKIRPYEVIPGETDKVYTEGLDKICKLIASDLPTKKELFKRLLQALAEIKNQYKKIKTTDADYPLIGVVGEIFCRLNTFSNNNLVRRLENLGAEIWLAGVSEWILYTNIGERGRMVEEGKKYSTKMLGAIIKDRIQKSDEHKITHIFEDILTGREEETNIEKLLEYSEPYLPASGSMGEMTVNVANACHFYHKGADGIIDISPFTCMNGIVSEAVYPRVIRDHNNMPIRLFYFDGTETDLERDLGIFLELAKNYRKKKNFRPLHTPS